jgi:hypothetical protein
MKINVAVHSLECSRHTPCAVRGVLLRFGYKVIAARDNAAANGTRSVPATFRRTARVIDFMKISQQGF